MVIKEKQHVHNTNDGIIDLSEDGKLEEVEFIQQTFFSFHIKLLHLQAIISLLHLDI